MQGGLGMILAAPATVKEPGFVPACARVRGSLAVSLAVALCACGKAEQSGASEPAASSLVGTWIHAPELSMASEGRTMPQFLRERDYASRAMDLTLGSDYRFVLYD